MILDKTENRKYSEYVNRLRTENTMAIRKTAKRQATIYKAYTET